MDVEFAFLIVITIFLFSLPQRPVFASPLYAPAPAPAPAAATAFPSVIPDSLDAAADALDGAAAAAASQYRGRAPQQHQQERQLADTVPQEVVPFTIGPDRDDEEDGAGGGEEVGLRGLLIVDVIVVSPIWLELPREKSAS